MGFRNLEIRKDILIVDDDLDDIDFLKNGCVAIGFETTFWFHTVKEAIDFLQSASDNQLPSLIVTDHNVSNDSGYELIQYLKAESRFSSIRTAILSTDFSKAELARFTAIGINGVFIKPSNMEGYEKLCGELKDLAY